MLGYYNPEDNVKNDYTGTTQVNEASYNPVLFAECVEASGQTNIEVPSGDKKITVHFYVEKGPVEVMFNDLSNVPPLRLYQDARWNQRFFDGALSRLILRPFTRKDYKVWVIIEKI